MLNHPRRELLKTRLPGQAAAFRFLLSALAAAATLAGALAAAGWGSVEDGIDADHISANSAELRRVQTNATDGEWALEVHFPGSQKDTWPGFWVKPDAPDCSKTPVLAFDCFNPSKDRADLNYRIDTLDGENVFGSTGLKPGMNKDAMIWLSAIGDKQKLTRLKGVYLYQRMPRKDVTLFFDNFRFVSPTFQFKRWVHVDNAPPLEPTAEEQRRGWVLFQRHWMEPVFADARPRPGERAADLGVFAARGEAEPLSFCIHALRDVELEVYVEPAKGVGIETSVVEYLDKRFVYSSKNYIADLPTYVSPLSGPLRIPAGQARQIWMTFHVEDRAPDGLHLIGMYVREGRSLYPMVLRLRVLPFALPEADGMLFGEYYPFRDGHLEPREQVRADLEDMRRHGMTSIGLCIGIPKESYRVDGTRVKLDFQGNSLFEWAMQALKEFGFPGPVIILSDSGQGAAADHPFGSEAYGEIYVNFWKAVRAEAKRRGWTDLIVQPVDEPSWQSQERKDRNVSLLKLLKAAGIPTEQDGPGDNYFHMVAGPLADVWNYNGGIGPRQVVAVAKSAGRTILLYNCDVECWRPETQRYVGGVFQRLNGIHGAFNWAYRTGRGSLYDDFDGNSGDWVHRYSPGDGRPGGPARGWEGFREGIDDFKYFRLAAGKDGEAVLLSVLEEVVNNEPRVRARAKWAVQLTREEAKAQGRVLTDPEAAGCLVGPLKHPSGLAYGEYDVIRWCLARTAMRQSLGTGGGKLQTSWARLVSEASVSPLKRLAVVDVPALSGKPVLDGKPTEPLWKGAARVSLVLNESGKAPAMPTEALLGTAEGKLWIAFVCHEDKMPQLTARVTEDQGRVWEDDCVEVFFDTNLDRRTFSQIIINTLGTLYRRAPDGHKWDVDVKAAVSLGDEAWCVEMAIPLASLDLKGKSFGLNLCRERRPTEAYELSAWSPTGELFGAPEKFGLANLERTESVAEAPQAFMLEMHLDRTWQYTQDSANTARIKLVAPTRASLRIALMSGGKRLGGAEWPVEGARLVRLAMDLSGLSEGVYQLEAELVSNGRAVGRAARPLVRVRHPCSGERVRIAQ